MSNLTRSPLLLPLLSVLFAAASVWLTFAVDKRFQIPSVILSLLAVGVIGGTLRQRRKNVALTRAAATRLGGFTVLMVLVAAVGLSLWLTQAKALGLVRPDHTPVTDAPITIGSEPYTTVHFLTPDGLTLAGWYVASRNGAVVILLHGHAGNRAARLDEAALLVEHGYGVLLYDARNSGESEGALTTFGLLEAQDVRGAVDFVLAQPGEKRVGILGHSMGSGTTLLAAAQIPEIKAVVVESAYTSLEDNIRTGVEQLTGLPAFPFAPLIIFWGEQETGINLSDVRPVEAIATLSPRPVMLIHGELDSVIPVTNAHTLYAAAHEPKVLHILPDTGHDGLLRAGGPPLAEALIQFFDTALVAP